MKILSFAITVAAVSSAVIPLDIHPDGFFQISYILMGNESDAGVAQLILPRTAGVELPSHEVSGYMNISTVDNQYMIAPSFLRRFTGSAVSHIPMGFRSAFARNFVSTYLLIPKHGQFVINPISPEDFVFGRELVTTTSTSALQPQVRVSVSILNSTQGGTFVPMEASLSSTGIIEFVLATNTHSRSDSVPSSIVDALYNELRRGEIPLNALFWPTNTLKSFDIIGNLTDDILDTLPIIQYLIHTDSGNDVVIQLGGRDYVGPFDGRMRMVFIENPDEDPNDDFQVFRAIGLNTLSKIALYIDNRNRTIGFGEPL